MIADEIRNMPWTPETITKAIEQYEQLGSDEMPPSRMHAAALSALLALRDALVEVERLKAWVSDCQAGMYINCVYCGHRYGPDDEVPATMADALKEHIEQCPLHPMSALKAERDRLTTELAQAKEYYRWQPISELHEDYGDCVLINIITGHRKAGSSLDLDFDESRWTHFCRIAPLSFDEGERLLAELRERAAKEVKLSERLREEGAFVERVLGASVICSRCSATLATFADACTADLCEPCPGYLAIEKAKTEFAKAKEAGGG